MCAEADVGTWEFTNFTTILEAELAWEKFGQKRVGNPFVFYNEVKGKYWLYYSASKIHLDDANVDEPLNLGLAESDHLMGPYKRIAQEPLTIPSGFPSIFIIGHGSLHLSGKKLPKVPEENGESALCSNGQQRRGGRSLQQASWRSKSSEIHS